MLALLPVVAANGAQARSRVSFPCELCLVEVGVDGHGQRLLRAQPGSSDLSPDGKRLLYSKYRTGIFTSLVNGSDERLVASDPAAQDALYSPNGAEIAYAHASPYDPANPTRCGDLEIRIVAASGGSPLTFQRCAVRPRWSSDSKRLLFWSEAAGETGRWWVAEADGSGRRVIGLWEQRSGYSPPSPAWSPRGDVIAYQTYRRMSPPSGHGTFTGGPMRQAETEIDLVRPDGTSVGVIPRAAAPAWSPDGSRLAFLRTAGNESFFGGDATSSLWIGDALGRNVRLVRKDFFSRVTWVPNGRWLVFFDENVYVMRPDGTGLRRVTNNPAGGAVLELWSTLDSSRFRYLWACEQEFQPCE
jgi:Tol biopolymer transport system component